MKSIYRFNEISNDDVPLVGGKNASLGEMYRELIPQGILVPNGFAISTDAYRRMLDDADAWDPLHAVLDGIDSSDINQLATRAQQARDIVYGASLSEALQSKILQAYRELQQEYGRELSVAVRSSATAEDLPSASFAGQHETYLHIRGEQTLLNSCRRCFASIFTDRAISYRINHGIDHFGVALSIGVMKMVRSDLAASGVMFTLDTESGFRDVVFITGAYGLGENIVQGALDPDEFYVHKPTYRLGHRAVLRRVLGEKQIKMVFAHTRSGEPTRNIPTPKLDRSCFCIKDSDVLTLADYAIKVEDHYSQRAGHPVPMDMEWAKDGVDGRIYLVQARPETVVSQQKSTQLEEYLLEGRGNVLVTGRAIGAKIATGRAHVISGVENLQKFQPGEILVTDMTTPDWGPVLKTAAAIITNRGGRTCHAAIVARELGVPAVVAARNATERISSGSYVTVSCAQGEQGTVYDGELPFEVRTTDLSSLSRPKTKIMMNLAEPALAFKNSLIPNDGVGLARIEFIISESVKIHPMALVHPEAIQDANERNLIDSLTRGYARATDFLVERLSEGIGTIAAAFYPKPVIVRLSDFKTNEYASLLGGSWFEASEANPMLGFRGASRYTHPDYAEGFALECAALKRVREQMGLVNVIIMIPFCRRVREAERVLAALEDNGLCRGHNELEIYLMCEIPNNVIQIDAFSKLFDGFSVGSNDLTQLTLGVDRDSSMVAFDYDERDPGVLEMIRQAIVGAKRNNRHSGICGQAPSDYPEMAEYLVSLGIDSISLNPDTVLSTTMHVVEIEKRLNQESSAKVSD